VLSSIWVLQGNIAHGTDFYTYPIIPTDEIFSFEGGGSNAGVDLRLSGRFHRLRAPRLSRRPRRVGYQAHQVHQVHQVMPRRFARRWIDTVSPATTAKRRQLQRLPASFSTAPM
jgi:hypothetical protein